MIVGVGLDLLYLPRLTKLIQRRNGGIDRLARRILTLEESRVLYEDDRLKGDTTAQIRYLAVRWV